MGRLHTIGSIEIRVYGRDHLPHHFHILHPDFEALISLATMTAIVGDLPRGKAAAALAWAVENRAAIVAEWNRLNPSFPTQ